ncbi:MAG TPA: ATP synthase F1 subunit delta [Thermoanaerobaculia bacterium]|nr:ATP synthase F1 subunit delta [Thermoanaerobaculia bacterium]
MIRRFAHPYAKAIMEVAGSSEQATTIRGDLTRFEAARKQSRELQEMYANPAIEPEAKRKVTRAIATRLSLSDMSVRVLDVLIGNGRINELESVIEALAEMVRQATGTVAARVRSAHPLEAREVEALRRALERKAGKKVELEVTTDPALIGGFVARIGSEVYDASVVGKISKFRESLD